MSKVPHCTGCGEYPGEFVADRIEELETQLSEARQVGKEWFEEQKKARKDANAVEAKLAKAVDALSYYAWNDDGGSIARNTLAELKGETDGS